MRPPKTLRVAGYVIPVEVVNDPDFTDAYHGEYGTLPRTVIRLSAENEPTRQRETLLHELLHAISDAFELEMSERQVAAMSRGLYGVLVDNPKLRAYLAE